MKIHLVPCLVVALIFPALMPSAPLIAWGIAATWLAWLPVRYLAGRLARPDREEAVVRPLRPRMPRKSEKVITSDDKLNWK